ncbi:MAG: peptidoglycan editing factor PgeF [Paramuribaculum sp.]|nr:peptidoglycan editing factor PgeF [Paramuribaculum sp.]
MTLEKIEYQLGRRVTAFSTLRGECDESDPYGGFSVCDYTGDAAVHVAECRAALCRDLGVTPDRLILPRQTHSARVAVIRDMPDIPSLDGVDALVTDIPGVALGINTADCVPVLLADDEAGVIGAVHSGWRGTVAKISAEAVKAMVTAGADVKRIKAVIAPSICFYCYEVGQEVADEFLRVFSYSPELIDRSQSKPHVSLAAAVFATLIDAGLDEDNIEFTDECTLCGDNLFSARNLGINSGRMVSVIMLREADSD